MNIAMVRYEDICEYPEDILTFLIEIMGYPTTEIKRALNLHPPMNRTRLGERSIFFNSSLTSRFRSSEVSELLRSEVASLLEGLGYARLIRDE